VTVPLGLPDGGLNAGYNEVLMTDAKGLKMCVSTQTPLVQFGEAGKPGGKKDDGQVLNLDGKIDGERYRYTPGGVTRMVFPLLRHMLQGGMLRSADWISLNPSAPGPARIGEITLRPVTIEKPRMAGYGKIKETIWGAVHGLPSQTPVRGMFWSDDFTDFTYYNRQTAELISSVDRESDLDVFYIHDFQQLPLGQMLHSMKPKIFRWHIPFDESMIPAEWREAMKTYFNSYDIVIASSARYLESLRRFGYSGKAYHVYPYVDLADYSIPSEQDVESLSGRLGLSHEDKMVLVVARMDPMKGQDRAIRTLAKAVKEDPRLKLVLVGNGSFSSSKGGVGLSKGSAWRKELESLAAELGVKESVRFAGHLSQSELDAAYERCEMTVLPSIREGFGLVVLESWIHKKPSIVSQGAGISEIIVDGTNGLLYDPDDCDALAEKILALTSDPRKSRLMGERGYSTSKRCYLDKGVEAEADIIAKVV
jgi:glycosyltransferase involved in cell wall biosynthesis